METAQPLDPELSAIAAFVDGKSRSDIGRLRDQKMAEVRQLAAQIRVGLCDGDNFPAKRDRRRIAELRKEVAYLSSLFDPESTPPPPEAA
jgi:hypothetical protein